ncbi:hypothetical protein [Lactococcus ileimucosae]|uniref:hypothetical protein n=1 Tax=Lactococcus ileimucosae TaxID=2941329 RepID=UPI0035134199
MIIYNFSAQHSTAQHSTAQHSLTRPKGALNRRIKFAKQTSLSQRVNFRLFHHAPKGAL